MIAAFGLLLAYLRGVPSLMWKWARRHLTLEINITDREEAFRWLTVWLANHPYSKRCRFLSVAVRRVRGRYDDEGNVADNTPREPQVILSPAPGYHLFFYKFRPVILWRMRKDAAGSGRISGSGSVPPGYREEYQFTILSRDQKLITDLIADAKACAVPPMKQRVEILRQEYNDWAVGAERHPRSLDSVILADGIAEQLLEDMKSFLASSEWYHSLGIPYRRGYLLYGQPGNGKSSLILALASELKMNICIVNLGNGSINDEQFTQLMGSVPSDSIVVIEDIDCVFSARKANPGEAITFSGFLNAIDGIMAGEGRMLFMTTNKREELDPALSRPGRCDIEFEIDNANRKQAERLFERFFPGNSNLAALFGSKAGGRKFSMAQLQGHLLQYKNSSQKALTNPIKVVDLKQETASEENNVV